MFVLNIRAVGEEEKKIYGQILGPNIVVSRGHFVLGQITDFEITWERFPKQVCKQKITSLMMLRKYERCVWTTFLETNQRLVIGSWLFSIRLLLSKDPCLSLCGIMTRESGGVLDFKGNSPECDVSRVVPPSWGPGQTGGRSTSGRHPTP